MFNIGDSVRYCPAWDTEWRTARIERIISPGGFLDRVFGGHSPVLVIALPGEPAFATSLATLRAI